MTAAKLTQLHDLDGLARATGVSSECILLYADSVKQAYHYKLLSIPKRGRKRRGEYRSVYKSLNNELSQLHRSVAMIVVNSCEFKDHVQGFVKRRSIGTNARLHLGAKLLLHADITNFFDTITTKQVTLALVSFGAQPKIADILARSCTIDGFLRQGTRCSPALANLVCDKLDREMLSLAESCKSTYSRYADDITFSGENIPTSDAVEFILKNNEFLIRDGRCYIQKQGRSQFVTGLTIADEVQPRLPRLLKRRLRLILHYINKYGDEAHFSHKANKSVVTSLSQLMGMLSFVHSIEPELAKKLRKMLPQDK